MSSNTIFITEALDSFCLRLQQVGWATIPLIDICEAYNACPNTPGRVSPGMSSVASRRDPTNCRPRFYLSAVINSATSDDCVQRQGFFYDRMKSLLPSAEKHQLKQLMAKKNISVALIMIEGLLTLNRRAKDDLKLNKLVKDREIVACAALDGGVIDGSCVVFCGVVDDSVPFSAKKFGNGSTGEFRRRRLGSLLIGACQCIGYSLMKVPHLYVESLPYGGCESFLTFNGFVKQADGRYMMKQFCRGFNFFAKDIPGAVPMDPEDMGSSYAVTRKDGNPKKATQRKDIGLQSIVALEKSRKLLVAEQKKKVHSKRNARIQQEETLPTGKNVANASSPDEASLASQVAIATDPVLEGKKNNPDSISSEMPTQDSTVVVDVTAPTVKTPAEMLDITESVEQSSIIESLKQVSNATVDVCPVCKFAADQDVGVCVACGSSVHTMCSINLDNKVDDLQPLICLQCHEEGFDVERVMPDLLRKTKPDKKKNITREVDPANIVFNRRQRTLVNVVINSGENMVPSEKRIESTEEEVSSKVLPLLHGIPATKEFSTGVPEEQVASSVRPIPQEEHAGKGTATGLPPEKVETTTTGTGTTIHPKKDAIAATGIAKRTQIEQLGEQPARGVAKGGQKERPEGAFYEIPNRRKNDLDHADWLTFLRGLRLMKYSVPKKRKHSSVPGGYIGRGLNDVELKLRTAWVEVNSGLSDVVVTDTHGITRPFLNCVKSNTFIWWEIPEFFRQHLSALCDLEGNPEEVRQFNLCCEKHWTKIKYVKTKRDSDGTVIQGYFILANEDLSDKFTNPPDLWIQTFLPPMEQGKPHPNIADAKKSGKWIELSPGNAKDSHSGDPIPLAHAPVMFFRQPGNVDSCVFSSLASALMYFGDQVAGNVIGENITASLQKTDRLQFANELLRTKKLKYVPKIFKRDQLDVLSDISHFPTLCILKGEDGATNHAVTVVGKWVFDANLERAIPLSRSSLDWCCSSPEIDVKWRSVHKALRCVCYHV